MLFFQKQSPILALLRRQLGGTVIKNKHTSHQILSTVVATLVPLASTTEEIGSSLWVTQAGPGKRNKSFINWVGC